MNAWTASPIPIAMQINNIDNSKGSFMGVLNLTINKAPTNPNDKVIEDLTINTTKKVVKVIKIKDLDI